MRLVGLRRYGLISKRGVDSTPLTKKIIHPNTPEERNEAMKDVFESIKLVVRISQVLGTRAPGDDFHITLQEALKVDRVEAQKKSAAVRRFYMQALPYIGKKYKEKQPEISKVGKMQSPQVTVQSPLQTSTQDSYNAIVEGISLQIPKDRDKLELAKLLIERWINQLGTKEKTSDRTTKKEEPEEESEEQ